ncbi:class I SAM-dependent methyltransferase [Amylibacter sp.]|nr:class I SAM-dependent methyltransferase [Amylibacter sp.]MDB4095655.1 class I SAM-dependent methyltransferase [Amylibacter sp.]
MTTSIYATLENLGLTSKKTRVLFNKGTRDVDDLDVWKDLESGVIYIDQYYTGDKTYVDGLYLDDVADLATTKSDFERTSDLRRRFKKYIRFVAGKRVVDFGCGSGDFLRFVQSYCQEAIGIELQENYVEQLNADGIRCLNNIDTIKNGSLDIVVAWHVIEHLTDPVGTLSKLIDKIESGGQIIIEVPHANDFLLSSIECEAFKQFTLWSQHLILHTRLSLTKILEHAGFKDIRIEGVQRYPLSNHLNWLSSGLPGGHKSQLAIFETDDLINSYEASLARIDATDTLVAIATVP